MLTLNKNGFLSDALGTSSQTFSSLRQIGNKPSCRLASLMMSAKGLGAVGSAAGFGAEAVAVGAGTAADAPAWGADAAAVGTAPGAAEGALAAGVTVSKLAHALNKTKAGAIASTKCESRGV